MYLDIWSMGVQVIWTDKNTIWSFSAGQPHIVKEMALEKNFCHMFLLLSLSLSFSYILLLSFSFGWSDDHGSLIVQRWEFKHREKL